MKRADHEAAARFLFGETYNPLVEQILDDPIHLRRYRNAHRAVTHNWQSLDAIRTLCGEVGYLQAWLHLALDFGVIKWRRPRAR